MGLRVVVVVAVVVFTSHTVPISLHSIFLMSVLIYHVTEAYQKKALCDLDFGMKITFDEQ